MADNPTNSRSIFSVEQKDDSASEHVAMPSTNNVEEVFGCLRYQGVPKSIHEMDLAIDEEIARRHPRN